MAYSDKSFPILDPFRAAYALHLFIGVMIERDALIKMIPIAVQDILKCSGVALLEAGIEPNRLLLTTLIENGDSQQVKNVGANFGDRNTVESSIEAWRQNNPFLIDARVQDEKSLLSPILEKLPKTVIYSAPATADGILYGVLLAYNLPAADLPATHETTTDVSARLTLLGTLAKIVGIALANARRYRRAEQESEKREFELNMLAQIDRELMDSIRLDSVFAMTLDWAMRYTRAHAAYVSLFDEVSSRLRPVASLGYERAPEAMLALFDDNGIAQRVGLTNRAEIIPDVSTDIDYVPISISMRSHLSIPVTREERVVAVITLESRKLNAFTDTHLDFIAKLSARAAIAIDNARLYADALREREQTAGILRAIADVVIVIGHDERIVLINASAISVLRLYPDQRYMGLKISEVLEDSPVLASFRKASTNAQVLTDQITFHPDRPYSVTVTPHVDIGWIIVMHDLTAVRRADQLKHDFISVLSHDLKQPIGVVKGYVELMEMNYPDLNERAKRYIAMIYQSLENMSKLIEDMLDLARLDSDIEITNGKVSIQNLILAVIEWIRPGAETKSMTIESNIPKELPPLLGDETRLIQLFVNLVHNAVKYTPPGGHVAILAEQIGDSIQVRVKDNGIGISPDDQKAIFARFFRVRRPETENIEGSGVGLTLVKKLVDLHKGQIGLESRLGEGTTFYVTLPIWND